MSTNPITGDALRTKANTDKYRSGHELIWGKKEPAESGSDSLEDKKDEADLNERAG